MTQICEITRKRIPHFSNLPEEARKNPKSYRRVLLKRKIKVPEINGSINIKISEEGLSLIKKAGGLASFLKARSDNKLSPRLLRLKRKIHGEPVEEKPAEEKSQAEAKTEAKPSGEKPQAESQAEAKPAEPAKKEEQPAKPAPAEEKPEAKKE